MPTLMLHQGGVLATRDQVAEVVVPQPTATWHPVGHLQVLEAVEQQLDRAGYGIAREQLGLARDGARFFAVLDLESKLAEGVGLALGLRNSIDQSFPYGLAGGTRTFVCDNLALTGDWDDLTITRKHTKHGNERFVEAIALGISKLAQYRELESARIDRMRQTVITDTEAYALFMRAYEARLLSDRVIRDCLGQWREPSADWGGATLWRLYNAMNAPIQHRAVTNPQAFSHITMKLLKLVAPLHDEPKLVENATVHTTLGTLVEALAN
jgi:Domain of unknown function (DUF932)